MNVLTPGVQHFRPGVRVRHRRYGPGNVLSPDRYTRADMVRVRFESAGILRVLAASIWSDP